MPREALPRSWQAIERRLPPALKVGERVRLAPGGPVYTVVRVGAGSAVLKGKSKPRAAFVAVDRKTGEEKLVPAFESEGTLHVSAHAFVERVEGE